MKKLVLYISIAFAAASCKFKDADPNLVQFVKGNYTIKTLKDSKGSYNLPYTTAGVTVSGTVVIDSVSNSNSMVNIKLSINQKSAAKTETSNQIESNIVVKKDGDNYKFEKEGQTFGSLAGKSLTLDFVVSKETTSVIAEKN